MLLPQSAIDECEAIMQKYAHKGDLWRTKDAHYHTMHAVAHLNNVFFRTKTDEDDLAHAAVRLLMALAVRRKTNEV
jgi:hypothetical protein